MSPRKSTSRAALVRATTDLVAEVGYQRATTRAIAERAGVAEGTIYRHFPDKKALFTAAVLQGQRELVDWMGDLPARAGGAPVAVVLTETLTRLSELREHIVPLETAMAAHPGLDDGAPGGQGPTGSGLGEEELLAALAERGGPPHLLATYLAAEQRLGRLRDDLPPARTAVLLLAAFYGMQTSPLARPDGLDPADLRSVVDVVLHGITAPPPG